MKPKLYLPNGLPLYFFNGMDIIAGEVPLPKEPHWQLIGFNRSMMGSEKDLYTLSYFQDGLWNGAKYSFEGSLPKEIEELLDSAPD